MSNPLSRVWRLWAKALGSKEGQGDREADLVAGIRTFLVVLTIVTNLAIMAGIWRHW